METIKRKLAKVVMLPTSKKTNIMRNKGETFDDLLFLNKPQIDRNTVIKGQYLYFITDDKIEYGDHVYLTFKHGVEKIRKCDNRPFNNPVWLNADENKFTAYKIIASSDPELKLPKPSDSFIEKYCDQNGSIDNVMIEYDWGYKYENGTISKNSRLVDCGDNIMWNGPKLSTNNTIIVKKLKDSWSKNELVELLEDAMNLGMDLRQNQLNGNTDKSGKELLHEWIDENIYK